MRIRPFWLAAGWALVAAVIYLSVARDLPDPGLVGGDKSAHVIAYATLMFWFCQAVLARGARCALACALIALGIALEFVQSAIGYRALEGLDMAADAAGVAIGWLAAAPRSPNVLSLIERKAARAGRPAG